MSTTFQLSREDKEKMLAPVLRSFYYDGQLDLDALCKHLKLDVFNFDFVDGEGDHGRRWRCSLVARHLVFR